MDTLSVISQLLHVREQTLRLALTTRTSKAGGADLFVTPYKMEEVLCIYTLYVHACTFYMLYTRLLDTPRQPTCTLVHVHV